MKNKCRGRHVCEQCGDNLIHQSNRGPDESSSGFGQFIHDNFDNNFYWIDVDGIIYKRSTGVFRVIEHKRADGQLRASQREVLPLMASRLDGFGQVFVVYSDAPHDRGAVQMVTGSGIGKKYDLEAEIWRRFCSGLKFR